MIENICNVLRKVDDFLIDRVFQKIADKVQEWTEKDCFWVAKLFFVQATLFVILSSVLGGTDKLIDGNWITSSSYIIVAIFSVLVSLMILWVFYQPSVFASFETKGKHKNPIRFHSLVCLFKLFSVFFFSISVMLDILHADPKQGYLDKFSDALMLVREVLMMIALYFLCCTPKPWQKGKIRQMIESMGTRKAATVSCGV